MLYYLDLGALIHLWLQGTSSTPSIDSNRTFIFVIEPIDIT